MNLSQLTRKEFRECLQNNPDLACILPVAAVEQHLEHLTMGHDWRSAAMIAHRVAERLTPGVLVAEALMVGVSEHHMKHPGTLTLQPGTFLSVVSDVIDSLVRGGFRHVLVLNGHGGNVSPLHSSWDQFLRKFPINLHWMSYWDVLNEQDARELLKGGHRLPQDLPGHAQEFETSIALAAFPDQVRIDAMRVQADTSPLHASAELGSVWLDRIVDRVSVYVSEMISGQRKQTIPPFHP